MRTRGQLDRDSDRTFRGWLTAAAIGAPIWLVLTLAGWLIWRALS
jgi:hypothetical protein